MANIVNISDFKGFYSIATNDEYTNNLQSYVDRYEDYYLCELLGGTLRTALIADLTNGVPTSTDYLKWFNPFCRDYDSQYLLCQQRGISKGIKDMLTGFIYYHWMHDQQTQSSLTGNVVNSNEIVQLLIFTTMKGLQNNVTMIV